MEEGLIEFRESYQEKMSIFDENGRIRILQKGVVAGMELMIYGTIEEPYFKAKDVVDYLGLKNVTDAVSRVDEEERVKFNLGRHGEVWMLTENGLYELLFQSRKKIAKEFKRGIKFVLHELRTKGYFGVDVKMKVIDWACKSLNVNETSKLKMVRSVLEPLGLPVPDYVVSNGIHHSAKELLEKNNIPMSVQAFNKLACANGYLERKTRKPRHGDKSFYIISEKGKQYGENLVSDKNPNETQPHWYDSRFKELLNNIGIVC